MFLADWGSANLIYVSGLLVDLLLVDDFLHGLVVLVVVELVALHLDHFGVEVEAAVGVENVASLHFVVVLLVDFVYEGDVCGLVTHFVSVLGTHVHALTRHVSANRLRLLLTLEVLGVPVILFVWSLIEIEQSSDESESQLVVVGLLIEFQVEDLLEERDEALSFFAFGAEHLWGQHVLHFLDSRELLLSVLIVLLIFLVLEEGEVAID